VELFVFCEGTGSLKRNDIEQNGRWRIWGTGRLKEMQNFEQVHVGTKQLKWPNGKWGGGLGVMKVILVERLC
jgi:hypothetical protein